MTNRNIGDPVDEVRIIRTTQAAPANVGERSRAQTIRDTILTEAENLLRDARDKTEEALDQFSLLAVPQHSKLPVLLGQQIEQVIEHRRLRQ